MSGRAVSGGSWRRVARTYDEHVRRQHEASVAVERDERADEVAPAGCHYRDEQHDQQEDGEVLAGR